MTAFYCSLLLLLILIPKGNCQEEEPPYRSTGFKVGCFKKVLSAIEITSKDIDLKACNAFCSLKSHPLSGQFWAFAVDNSGARDPQCYCLKPNYDIRHDYLPYESLCSQKCPTDILSLGREYTCLENTYMVYTPCKSGHWGPNFYCTATCPTCNPSPPPLDKWTFCGFDGSCVEGCDNEPCPNKLYKCDEVSAVPDTAQLAELTEVWDAPERTIIFPSLKVNTDGTVLKAIQMTASESYPYLGVYRNETTENDTAEVWKKMVVIPTYDKEPRTHVYFDEAPGIGEEPKIVKVGDVLGVSWNKEMYEEWPEFLHKKKGGYLYSSQKFASIAMQHLGWDQMQLETMQGFTYASQPLAFAIELHIGCACPANCANYSCKRTGECYKCEPGYRGLFCEEFCQEGRFGQDCISVCSLNCTDQKCDPLSGNCTVGCKTGRQGARCQHLCDHGKYGLNCERDCGFCKHNATCTPENGLCYDGCADWYNPPFCKDPLMCKPGFYGLDCSLPCGYCKDQSCNVRDGHCVCQDYYYGAGCLNECGVCMAGAPCDWETGECSRGCSPYYEGELCKDLKTCPVGKYGSDCDLQCGNCLDNMCHIMNGTCVNGCIESYKPPMCLEKETRPGPLQLNIKTCPEGKFGPKCTKDCVNCKYNVCDQADGNCIYGCEGLFFPPLCEKSCNGTHYGTNCLLKCGHCKNNACDPESGLCQDGCQINWSGPKCLEQCVTEDMAESSWSKIKGWFG